MKSIARVGAWLVWVFGLQVFCVAQSQGQWIPAKDLLSDAAILQRAYETLHPGLNRYNTPEQMRQNFNELNQELSRDQSLGDAYLAFSRFTAKVKCGHSYPNFFNQPKEIAETLFQGQNRLPFYFRWIDRRMIVTRDFSANHVLAPGDEIVAIDGVPATIILNKLLSIARADGSNDAKRLDLLSVRGDSKYETFDIYFPMFFPPRNETFRLEVLQVRNKKSRFIQVPALNDEQRVEAIRTRVESKNGDAPLWSFRFLTPKVGYLQMPDWALYNSKWDWQGFLKEVFTQLDEHKAGHFVIDLRGNEGGLDAGNPILAHLVEHALNLNFYERRVRYRKVADDLAPYLDTWDPSFKDWGDQAIDLHDGFFRLTRFNDDDRGDVIKPEGKRYAGRVWVIIDAANSSATFQFARVIRDNHLGTLVGETTGGNLRGINGGAFFFLRLPHSHIEIDLPLIGTFPATPQPDSGLEPDILVTTTRDAIARGDDTVLETIIGKTRAVNTHLDTGDVRESSVISPGAK